jgi:hypothetical protein
VTAQVAAANITIGKFVSTGVRVDTIAAELVVFATPAGTSLAPPFRCRKGPLRCVCAVRRALGVVASCAVRRALGVVASCCALQAARSVLSFCRALSPGVFV